LLNNVNHRGHEGTQWNYPLFLRPPLCSSVVNAVALSGDEPERLYPKAG